MFPEEMSEWPPRSYVERILILHNGQKCKVEVILLQWSNQNYLVNDIVKFAKLLVN